MQTSTINSFRAWYEEILTITQKVREVSKEEANRFLTLHNGLLDGCWEAGIEAEHSAELINGVFAD